MDAGARVMADDLFGDSLRLVAKLVDRGELLDAATVLRPWLDSGLPPFETTIVSYNLAQVYAHMGRGDDVLAWFDHGIAIERPLRRTLLVEGKAAWLADNGRPDDAVALWLELLGGDCLDAEGRNRVEGNLATVMAR